MTVVRSGYAQRDLYETEAWAVMALCRQLDVSGKVVWEPAAGRHAIVRALLASGARRVISSDIVSYGPRQDFLHDFIGKSVVAVDCDIIVTNPPFGQGNRIAVTFVERALERCPGTIAMLLTGKFDFGKTRQHLFRDCPRFMVKIALTDRIQWFPGVFGGTEDHAWYIWGPDSYAVKQLAWEGKHNAASEP